MRRGTVQPMAEMNEQEEVEVMSGVAWLSYSEARLFSGLGRTKLWELISAGDVEAAKVGRAVRISRRSLDKFMRRNRYAETRR